MLGLEGVRNGMEGLDEASKELLGDLKTSPMSTKERIPASTVISEGGVLNEDHDGDEGGQEQEVRFNKRGRWFGASISGQTRGNEEIGQELNRCFQAIQRTYRNVPLFIPFHFLLFVHLPYLAAPFQTRLLLPYHSIVGSERYQVDTDDEQENSNPRAYPSQSMHPTSPSSSLPCPCSYLPTKSTPRTLVHPHRREPQLPSHFLVDVGYGWKWLDLMIVFPLLSTTGHHLSSLPLIRP